MLTTNNPLFIDTKCSPFAEVSQCQAQKKKSKQIFLISKITKEHCLNSEFLQSFIQSSNNDDNAEFNFDGLINALVNIKQSNTVSAFHLNFLEFKKVLN